MVRGLLLGGREERRDRQDAGKAGDVGCCGGSEFGFGVFFPVLLTVYSGWDP